MTRRNKHACSNPTRFRRYRRKLSNNFTLPSLHQYLIFRPDKPHVIHHERDDPESILTRIVTQRTLSLDPPGIYPPAERHLPGTAA
ncbi:MAG: hypothetical protein JO122_17240 [Acetobacteraceae bacterium]|nr:hypothetical protein [Acetobacteraceae bacterium]